MQPAGPFPPPIRSLRLLGRRGDRLFTLLKLRITGRDESLYVVPYAPRGPWRFGDQKIAAGDASETFRTDLQQSSREKPPHLSFHATGLVHAYVDDRRTIDLRIPPLRSLRGQHVLSIVPDDLSALPSFDQPPRFRSGSIDYVIPIVESVRCARIAMYVNGAAPRFDGVPTRGRPGFVFEARSAADRPPLYVGFLCIPQEPLGGGRTPSGVTLVAGWDPTASGHNTDAHFLFFRGTAPPRPSLLRRLARRASSLLEATLARVLRRTTGDRDGQIAERRGPECRSVPRDPQSRVVSAKTAGRHQRT